MININYQIGSFIYCNIFVLTIMIHPTVIFFNKFEVPTLPARTCFPDYFAHSPSEYLRHD